MTNSRKVLIVVVLLFLFGLVSKVIVEVGGLEDKVEQQKTQVESGQ